MVDTIDGLNVGLAVCVLLDPFSLQIRSSGSGMYGSYITRSDDN